MVTKDATKIRRIRGVGGKIEEYKLESSED